MRYFDLHCDTITECYARQQPLRANSLHVSLERAAKYRPWAQVFAVWIPDDLRGEQAAERFDRIYDTFRSEMDRNAQMVRFCRNPEDFDGAVNEGKAAAFLSIEGGAALAGNMQKLADAYDRGVRMITLTWNGRCETGDGCMTKDAGGLTDFGFALVREMQRRRMIVDVSHLSEKGFWDVARTLDGPFVASHSDSAAVCAHPRNLTDAQFAELVRRGGLVGINLFPPFLHPDGKAGIPDILRHVEHFLERGGRETLAVGADFDGADMPEGIAGAGDMETLAEELAKHYDAQTADRIFFRNAADFFRRNL